MSFGFSLIWECSCRVTPIDAARELTRLMKLIKIINASNIFDLNSLCLSLKMHFLYDYLMT